MNKDKANGELERMISDLRKREPVLERPDELTDAVMAAIRIKEAGSSQSKKPAQRPQTLTFVTRLLAAASVCLFLVFGYEQYVVVDKIGRLEAQNATISQNSKYTTAIKINQFIALAKADPNLLRHYSMLEQENPNKLHLLKAAIFLDIFMISGNDSIHQKIIK
jgi:hypothetical protein